MLKGVRISRGVALGRLYLYAPFVPQVEQGPCMPGGEEAQRQAYRRAKEASAKELLGLAEAGQEAKRLTDEAVEALAPFGLPADTLRGLAIQLFSREK